MTEYSCRIEISLAEQRLRLLNGATELLCYPVSTAKNGAGELMDSECTPCGEHVIAEKIGDDSPLNTVFIGRQASGEIYVEGMREQYPHRDWILTRILWLRGCEAGRNLHGVHDSYARYIYIHGTPDDVDISVPGSRGCVRMRNAHIVDVFDRVQTGTAVTIYDD